MPKVSHAAGKLAKAQRVAGDAFCAMSELERAAYLLHLIDNGHVTRASDLLEHFLAVSGVAGHRMTKGGLELVFDGELGADDAR